MARPALLTYRPEILHVDLHARAWHEPFTLLVYGCLPGAHCPVSSTNVPVRLACCRAQGANTHTLVVPRTGCMHAHTRPHSRVAGDCTLYLAATYRVQTRTRLLSRVQGACTHILVLTVDATYRVQTRTHLLSHVQGACTHIMCVHAPTDACARIQAVRDKKKYRPIVFYRRGSMRATEPSLTR